jgi:UDP-N-acetylglucosamine 2-epimerase (non-hydrolysing)
MLIDLIVGTRPNFVKVASLIAAFAKYTANNKAIQLRLIHTGQHYDKYLNEVMFQQLELPEPDIHLNCIHEDTVNQLASIITAYNLVLHNRKPDLLIVVGDVTSTLACTMAAKKFGNIKIAHVEAGIRSGDLDMPEEINRIVTDALSDLHFTPTQTASDNLLREGIPASKIVLVGNTMIDTLRKYVGQLPSIQGRQKAYLVMTIHRHKILTQPETLRRLLNVVNQFTKDIDVVFPIHPHTQKVIKDNQIDTGDIICKEPMGYLDFMQLVKSSSGVITDSGGLSEETTILNKPCITLRDTTERPETCTLGTNFLVGHDEDLLTDALQNVILGNWKQSDTIPYWDGFSADRIVDYLLNADITQMPESRNIFEENSFNLKMIS